MYFTLLFSRDYKVEVSFRVQYATGFGLFDSLLRKKSDEQENAKMQQI